MAESVEQFAARIKSKYPDYQSVPDKELVDRIIAKHPEYKSQVDFGPKDTILQLQHKHNLNRAAEAEAQFAPIAAGAKMIAEPMRMLGIAGGPLGAAAGEAGAQAVELAGGARESFSPTEVGAQAAIPAAIGVGGKIASKTLGPLMEAGSKKLYSSALKLSTAMKPAKRESILATGLAEAAMPTRKGVAQQTAIINEMKDKIKATIATRPDAPVDATKVAARIDDVAPRFETVTPEADRAILQGAKEEFIRNNPTLGAATAQTLKTNTYRTLGEKAYGELKTSQKEAEKALARGLKEELENIFPELRQLNAKEAAAIDLKKALERAASRIQNRDLIGIGLPIKATAGAMLSPSSGAIMGLLAGMADQPWLKSKLAFAVLKARNMNSLGAQILGRTATLPSVDQHQEE